MVGKVRHGLSRSVWMRRGVVLVGVLFLMLFMAILAAHVFYMRMTEHRAGVLHLAEVQAQRAALSGLEDAKVKLMKDPLWPHTTVSQKVYVYGDTLSWGSYGLAGYRVAVRRKKPNVVVTCWGYVGDPAKPTAQRQVQAVFDPATAKFSSYVDWGSF